MLKNVRNLEIKDILYRIAPIKEQCEILDITTNGANFQRVFHFHGFLVNQTAMTRIFKNTNGVFETWEQ